MLLFSVFLISMVYPTAFYYSFLKFYNSINFLDFLTSSIHTWFICQILCLNMLLQTSLLICFLVKIFAQIPCQVKTFNSSENIACVCNSTYCDELPQLPQLNADQAAVYVTSKSGKRFELSNLSFVSDASSGETIKIVWNFLIIYF